MNALELADGLIAFLATYIIVFMLGSFALFITIMTVLGIWFYVQDAWLKITFARTYHKEHCKK